MGAFPARIAAQDFVTPPEFAHLHLARNGAARIGGARLVLAMQGAQTRLSHLYEQTPIRVLPFHLGAAEPTLIYLANSTNGIMDGDAQRFDIHAEAGTHTVVIGQSATRVHPCLHSFCTQQWKITVAADATLVVLPGPTIPFSGCRFYQHVEIDLCNNATLLWGEIWFTGRYARGDASERCRFETIVQDFRVRRQSQLVYRDRFCWRGPWSENQIDWHFGANESMGTLSVFGAMPSSNGALFPTAAGDHIARWTGSSESVIKHVVENAGEIAGRSLAPWLIGRNQLGPTHWFDVRPL